MHRTRSFLLLAGILLAGCDVFSSDSGNDSFPSANTVLVANQGNFSQANGSVTVYDVATKKASQPAQWSNFGSIVQSIAQSQTQLYVLGNSGNRIEVYNINTGAKVAQIDSVVSPRYIAGTSSGKAYVTSLYGGLNQYTDGMVTVIDLQTNRKVRTIPVGDNPEGIVVFGTRAYVANHGFGAGRTLSVLNTTTDAVVGTIDVGCDGPRFLIGDTDGEIFAFCTGRTLYDANYNVIGETKGGIRVLNAQTGEIVRRIDLDGRILTHDPGQDVYYDDLNRIIYAVMDKHTILKISTATNDVIGELGPIEGAPIGAIAVDPGAERLYIGHVPSYTESGTVTIHTLDGTKVDQFTAGISPTYIMLR